MPLNATIGELVGCDMLYIAQVLEDSKDRFVTGAPEFLAPLGEVKDDPKAASASSSYDNAVMFTYFTEGIGETTLTIPGLTERRAAALIGKPYDNTRGIVFDNGDLSRAPVYALAYRTVAGSTDSTYHKLRWFLKGKFLLSATIAKSAGEKIDAQSQEVTYYPTKTVHQWTLPDPKNAGATITDGLKASKTDTTDPAFTGEASWFSQVQTPDTVTPPAAFAVSDTTPENGTSGVSANVQPSLTFSNAVNDYTGVSLVNATTGALVASTVSLDETGKVLSVAPKAALGAATAYLLILAGVTDIYGQSITQSIKFTTA